MLCSSRKKNGIERWNSWSSSDVDNICGSCITTCTFITHWSLFTVRLPMALIGRPPLPALLPEPEPDDLCRVSPRFLEEAASLLFATASRKVPAGSVTLLLNMVFIESTEELALLSSLVALLASSMIFSTLSVLLS
jgi:hypothetical protein